MNELMSTTPSIPIKTAIGLLLAVALWLLPTLAHAQTDTIHGVINRYAKVLFMCNGAFVVDNPYGFKRGDKVLIIQMKGAVIDTADSSSFGDILSYGNAGNYELAELDQVNGTTLVPKHHLVRTYDVPGLVQIVRVPTYANVGVSDTLTAKAWDGNTGGVLALIATGTLTLNADIDVTGKGFRGERRDSMVSDSSSELGWRFPDVSGEGSYKGEGITQFQASMRSGRGKLATGGGGGNNAGTGGGGGGNAGPGGVGGDQSLTRGQLAIGGRGGDSCLYDTTLRKVFLGGGGGASGYEDISNAWAGSPGGGIILLAVDTIVSNNQSILANGSDNAERDTVVKYIGAGGGGAGGSILLQINVMNDTLRAFAKGGKGGSAKSLAFCCGPGGGGGGGCIWFSATSIPGKSICNDSAGPAGIVLTVTGTSTCIGTVYGATSGFVGKKRTHLQIPQGTIIRIP